LIGVVKLKTSSEEPAAGQHSQEEQGRDLLRSGVAIVAFPTVLDLTHNPRFNLAATDALHHGEMLEVVVGLKECIPGEKLDEDTANAPNIARIAPSQIQYDLWCSVMSCGNDRGMVFVVEGGRPEINQPDLCIK